MTYFAALDDIMDVKSYKNFLLDDEDPFIWSIFAFLECYLYRVKGQIGTKKFTTFLPIRYFLQNVGHLNFHIKSQNHAHLVLMFHNSNILKLQKVV